MKWPNKKPQLAQEVSTILESNCTYTPKEREKARKKKQNEKLIKEAKKLGLNVHIDGND